MAKKVHVTLVDDLDETTEASETVLFGLDGVSYEIDLSEDNAARLRDALARYVGVARKIGGARRRGAPATTGGGATTKDVRDWAREQGMEVSERGRVSAEVRQAYDAAH